MNIYLTFDYELFFGSNTGTVQKCLIEPTNQFLEMADKYGVKAVFFIDIGYLSRLQELQNDHPALKKDYELVAEHLNEIKSKGHDLQLHIHPHWEDAIFENGKWQLKVEGRYKLSDFPKDKAAEIIEKYANLLNSVRGSMADTFRAGGWCIQPFDHIREALFKVGVRKDSSVFPGAHFEAGEYSFDFRKAPDKDEYRFNSDVCVEEPGDFAEFPISSKRYSPLFYWRLYILGRLNPTDHKMLGNGNFIPQPGRKKSVLTGFTWNHVSCDGYYTSVLDSTLVQMERRGRNNIVIIGHPKSFTRYSLKKMDEFMRLNHEKHQFVTFSEQNENN
jgi:hypothetical protein